MNIADYIDHTLLNPTATPDAVEQLCQEAVQHAFKAVCVHGCYAKLAAKCLRGSKVQLAVVTGFPLGVSHTKAKIEEAVINLQAGADELDMVLNLGLLKAKKYKDVEAEISKVKNIMGEKILKVIIETTSLTDEEKRIASRLVVNAGADFVKTSTGFANGGATPDDVRIIKDSIGSEAQIKASGGIRDFHTAKHYISLGVTRIGTSSGMAILNESQREA